MLKAFIATATAIRSSLTSGLLRIAGPAAGTTRTMTVPDANFTAARTDAAQSFTGNQTFNDGVAVGGPGTSGRLHVTGAGNTSATNAAYIQSSDSELMIVRNDGRISTGATTLSPYNNTSGSAANLYVDANGILYRSTSSLRYKQNVQTSNHGLAELLKLRSITYQSISKENITDDTVYGGLIAEEVDRAGLKEFVVYDEDGNPDGIHYGHMVALLIKAIQEQQEIIANLQKSFAKQNGGK